jgi:hypothetical protein
MQGGCRRSRLNIDLTVSDTLRSFERMPGAITTDR